jgi:ribosomal protein L11 methylase PrmA
VPLPAGSTEEAELLMRWLSEDGTRLVAISDDWSLPAAGFV